MVVDNLGTPDMSVAPFEADPKLVVDPDTPLPFAILLQPFQSILRRHAQKFQCRRGVEQLKLANRDTCNVGEMRHAPSVEQVFRVGTLEGLDHQRILTFQDSSVNG